MHIKEATIFDGVLSKVFRSSGSASHGISLSQSTYNLTSDELVRSYQSFLLVVSDYTLLVPDNHTKTLLKSDWLRENIA
jgi:hypothetical protein